MESTIKIAEEKRTHMIDIGELTLTIISPHEIPTCPQTRNLLKKSSFYIIN